MNLLDETKSAISQSGHSTDDVRFVGSRDGELGIPWSQAEPVPRNATPEMLARWQEREIALAERQMGGGR